MQSSRVGIGVVGYGYWGPNLVRNFVSNPSARVVSISDLDPEKLAASERLYPGVATTGCYEDLLKDPSIDAIAIATPVQTHYELALAALKAGKHVLVEKPLAPSAEQVRRLIDEADRRGLTLMVDHTFLYTPAVQKIRELVQKDELGEIYYYDSTRSSLGLFQSDVNVIWDLAVHDLSIIQYILDEDPVAVSATGSCHVAGTPENMAHITLFFDSKCVAHVSVNWLSPIKVRQTFVGGSKKMIVYDDLEPTEKIKVYDKGITAERAVRKCPSTPDRISSRRHVGASHLREGGAADRDRAFRRLRAHRIAANLRRPVGPACGRDSRGGIAFDCRPGPAGSADGGSEALQGRSEPWPDA